MFSNGPKFRSVWDHSRYETPQRFGGYNHSNYHQFQKQNDGRNQQFALTQFRYPSVEFWRDVAHSRNENLNEGYSSWNGSSQSWEQIGRNSNVGLRALDYQHHSHKSRAPYSKHQSRGFSNYQSLAPRVNSCKRNNNQSSSVACYTCGKCFLNKRQMWAHKDEVHPTQSFYCKICNKQFGRLWSLKEHEKTHPVFACEECPETFRYESSYEAHVAHAHPPSSGQRKWIAETNSGDFKMKSSSFQSPIASSTPSGSFVANQENQEKSRNSSTDSGISVKSEKFSCPLCIKSFETADRLSSHARIHTELAGSTLPVAASVDTPGVETSSIFACPLCIKKLSSRRQLHLHLNSVHTVTFYCPKCPAEFAFEVELRAHSKVHN